MPTRTIPRPVSTFVGAWKPCPPCVTFGLVREEPWSYSLEPKRTWIPVLALVPLPSLPVTRCFEEAMSLRALTVTRGNLTPRRTRSICLQQYPRLMAPSLALKSMSPRSDRWPPRCNLSFAVKCRGTLGKQRSTARSTINGIMALQTLMPSSLPLSYRPHINGPRQPSLLLRTRLSLSLARIGTRESPAVDFIQRTSQSLVVLCQRVSYLNSIPLV